MILLRSFLNGRPLDNHQHQQYSQPMEIARSSLWLFFFALFCFTGSVSANPEDKKLPSAPANLKELKYLKGVLERKAEEGFKHEELWKEQKHMKGESVGRILKGGAGPGNEAVHGGGYRRTPSQGTSSATSFRLSGTFFPLLLKDLFPLFLAVVLIPVYY